MAVNWRVGATGMMAMMLALAPARGADERGRASDRAFAPLVACRPIADPRTRALCYDAALDKLQQSVSDRTIVVMDREQVKEDRKATFGFIGAPIGIPAPPKPVKAPRAGVATEELDAIDSTVASAVPFGYDRWTIRIATGAVWRTTEAGIPTAPRPGTEVHIRRGVMGSFLMRVGKARALRAMRVN